MIKFLSTLLVRQLKPFGVKLSNVDLDCPEQHDQIQKLLYKNGVLIVPADGAAVGAEPIHTDARMLQLAELFGQIESYHPVLKSKDAAGRIQILETMGDTGIPNDSFLFHSDMSWRINPSRASVLCACILPSTGGDTRFQSANLMYRNLSQELRDRLHGISAVHSLNQCYARVNRPNVVQDEMRSIHPAAIKHPDTGVPLLYLNQNFTMALVGMSEDDSTALLNRVFEEATNPDQILRHSWTPGDVVVWDNLGVQHQVMKDYQGLRRMHRVVAHDPHLQIERYVSD
ncbi:MAG: TauD/TfdA family dioxygenase [Microcoleaceae cyanobacterium]